ncbi:hypothetical protein K488DRAFT_69507 [Vararia minispora EC-137]|uniref:Uncharacterized protein n=1 Tax=Vararia minispora EC-137 TaxID=1314806 RepID=A0ACB8QQ98_9AGAM|nr:hypothetical protein K488DRAFT_69507 [Vararia minispora EC-137]
MAFPVPEHLPRAAPQDTSTHILTKVASATNKGLTAELASSWISELDEALLRTKTRIHERIHSDLPAFEARLRTSYSIQERLRALATNVNILSESVSHSEGALKHLVKYRQQFETLEALADSGKLSEAAEAARWIEAEFEQAPQALAQSDALSLLKSQFRALKDRVEEQLSDAYLEAVSIAPNRIVIRPIVGVRQSSASITLPAIFASFTPDSLTNHLNSLRRDILTHYIEQVLTSPTSVVQSIANDEKEKLESSLTVCAAPCGGGDPGTGLDNLADILEFLNAYLLPALPLSHAATFKRSLCKPITDNLLNKLLIPQIPSSFVYLPAYLGVTRRAVQLEERYIIGVLGQDARDRSVRSWAERVSAHYERKRSANLLDLARKIVLREDDGGRIPVDVDVETPNSSPEMAEVDQVPPSPASVLVPATATTSADPEEDNWGLDDGADDSNGWGLDEDEPIELAPKPTSPKLSPLSPPNSTGMNGSRDGVEVDPGDAWGWNDDEEDPSTDVCSLRTSGSAPTPDDSSSTWDDYSWGDAGTSVDPGPPPKPSPPPRAPRPATRLEKLANKGKTKHTSRLSTDSVVTRPPPPTPASPFVQHSMSARKVTVPIKTAKPIPSSPALPSPTPPRAKETYTITSRARELAVLAESALCEGTDFARATLFDDDGERGRMIVLAAVGILDLFRALYPVAFEDALVKSPERPMLFANDCRHLCKWTKNQQVTGPAEGLEESGAAMEALGETWFDLALETQERAIVGILSEVNGFNETYDQDCFDECEAAVTRDVLTKSKYFTAVGGLVDAALSRVLEDILALSDITEVESHRLSELCRIFNALEGLFLDDPKLPSLVVAHVPSWLKFSYLSELLEASLADTTYLFGEGALVDFEVDELIKLVKALFAETPQRASLIQKLAAGHPEVA